MTNHVTLSRGERLLWAGRPHAVWRHTADRRLVLLGLFLVGWAAVAILISTAPNIVEDPPGAKPIMLFAAIVTASIGLFLGMIGLLSGHRRLRRTEYVLTDRRLIVTTTHAHSVDTTTELLRGLPAPVTSMSLRRGWGTVQFGEGGDREHPVLYAIDGARRVQDLIVAAQAVLARSNATERGTASNN
ncbi:hypothetical protein EV193_1082 [Herbihabitans rhizosphaerae]|uniref:PH (Pleckstrin Homology) domain-containing protein n=1 Tax=Herbihabitans rhizosphaerae TaxID=1872711 RepID=A0A4Q7KJ76_9PSEU|nr:hypothetical protein [Herbihabitans rhizosphaerae]RZS34654.1 hypothetical protein EV193_1082 [Herbihabitans rhizosphaerae]